jgi:hypothetical protein
MWGVSGERNGLLSVLSPISSLKTGIALGEPNALDTVVPVINDSCSIVGLAPKCRVPPIGVRYLDQRLTTITTMPLQ